jgi:hypothetical protein
MIRQALAAPLPSPATIETAGAMAILARLRLHLIAEYPFNWVLGDECERPKTPVHPVNRHDGHLGDHRAGGLS